MLRGKFRTVIRLGLLDPPSIVPYSSIGSAGEPEPWTTEKHKHAALDVARESVVLLKNANGLLPLDKNAIKSIAVVGPRADEVLIDLYGGKPPYAITPLAGIRAKVGPGIAVNYAANNDNGAAVKLPARRMWRWWWSGTIPHATRPTSWRFSIWTFRASRAPTLAKAARGATANRWISRRKR